MLEGVYSLDDDGVHVDCGYHDDGDDDNDVKRKKKER